jgi:hypothetical protein
MAAGVAPVAGGAGQQGGGQFSRLAEAPEARAVGARH